MPRLFLPNKLLALFLKMSVTRPLTSKPLFPQESQSLQGLVARKRMLFPVFHTLPHFGIMFCDAKIRRKNGTTNHSNQKLVKERLCYYSVFFCLFHRANHRLDELGINAILQ